MHSSRTTTRQLSAAARWGGLVAAGTFALTGCGLLPSQRTAETAPPPPPPAPPAPSTPAPLPPRPFEARMDGVDPCELLTSRQRGQLGFDREPLADTEAGFGDAPTCSFRNATAKVGARLSLITTEPMSVWTDDTAQVQATPVVLAGFPALVIKTPDLDMACNVAVDVADGQHLDVLYRDDGGQPAPPLDALCAGAQRVAEDAVSSLANPAPPSSSAPSSEPPDERSSEAPAGTTRPPE